MPCSRLALWLLLGLGAPAAAQVDAPALFANNCAKCHGLDGSGTGPTVLDRPARNFKEGGFSFGNTPAVIARTIAHGIPGSPMPSFEGAFSDEQLRALAEYVVTLGPPVKEVSEAETLLHVTDRPLVVRGILPPIEEGGPIIPRGLLIGTTDGLTFQYAADDVRLLAVRQGDFVKRTDWGDRGGSPLEPLGKVVWRHGAPIEPWAGVVGFGKRFVRDLDVDKSLPARLLSTTSAPAATVSYVVASEANTPLPTRALITESPGRAALGEHAGFARRLRARRINPGSPDHKDAIALRLGEWTEVLREDAVEANADGRHWQGQWWMRTVEPDTGELLHLASPGRPEVALDHGAPTGDALSRVGIASKGSNLVAFIDLSENEYAEEDAELVIETFVVSPWSPEVVAQLRQEVSR